MKVERIVFSFACWVIFECSFVVCRYFKISNISGIPNSLSESLDPDQVRRLTCVQTVFKGNQQRTMPPL